MHNDRQPIILTTDAAGLANITEPVVLVLMISRENIEPCNIASTMERLHVLTDTQDSVHRFRDSMVFQVTGYDADHRDLAEIPEVRAFFARLSQEWPHWLWFLHRDVGMIALFMSLLCRVQIQHRGDQMSTEFLDRHELGKVMLDLFERGNAMFNAYAVSPADAKASAESAVRELAG
ncbi:chlororespiratory reduction 6 domain-containing protein [Hydrogenophaga defluvii]|uniref:Chlororespiratory reduction 6 domain-containing protein n=1 Tax=Hydrogenophaga defluvii TaxID=249410 RepID=A0ABW2SFG8_9BURK